MIQRKQTLYLLAAIVMTVICLCMQIGTFHFGVLGNVAHVYNLWYTLLGKHYFDTWPLMAVLLPTTVIGTYAIFLYRSRKVQALLCLFNALLIVGWYVCLFFVGKTVGEESWGLADFRPSWPAAFPAVAFVLYLMARRAILADEKLVRSLDRIR